MPEGDTVFLAATRLNAALADSVLTKTDFRVPRLATVDLSGRRIRGVVARGKHLLIRIEDDVTLHTHYKMEGSWHLYRPGERWRGPDFQVRAVLYADAWHAVGFRLAIVELLDTAEEGRVVGHLGPDPLRPDWDAQRVSDAIAGRPDAAIGEVVLDQRVIAGPGNVYKCEACFLAGVDPATPVRDVVDVPRLVDLLARLMQANRKTGTQITTGDLRPGRQRWVYGRAGEPCFRCRTLIRRAEQRGYGGDRVTYWCPTCQPSRTSQASPRSGITDRTV